MSDAPASSPGVSGRLRRAIGRWLPSSTAGCAASLTWLFLVITVAVVWTMFFRGPENVPWRHAIGIGRIALVTFLVFAIPIVLYRALRLWLEGERSLYPEISNAWAAGMDALREHDLDLNDLAFYLVLGSRGIGQERAIMQSGKQPLLVQGVPEGPAPMHWYATADAVYLFCSDASWASALAAKRQRELEEFGDPASRRPRVLRPSVAAASTKTPPASPGPANVMQASSQPASSQPASANAGQPGGTSPGVEVLASGAPSPTAPATLSPPTTDPSLSAKPSASPAAAISKPASSLPAGPGHPSPSSPQPPTVGGAAPTGPAPMGTVQLDQFLSSPASQSFAESFPDASAGQPASVPPASATPPATSAPAASPDTSPSATTAGSQITGRPVRDSAPLRGTMQLDGGFVSGGATSEKPADSAGGFADPVAGSSSAGPSAGSQSSSAAFSQVPSPGLHAATSVPFPVPETSPPAAATGPAVVTPLPAIPSDDSGADAGFERKPVTMNAKESALRVGRLTYLCQQINRFREPLCPINGVLTLLPYAAIDGGTDDAEALQQAVKGDLTTLHYVLKIRCPVTALVTDMERQSGFRELMRRVGRERVAVQRFGRKYDCRSLATETEMMALSELVCGTFEDWIYALFREDEALTRPGNQQLYHLLCQIRCTLKMRLTKLLQGAFAYDPEQGSAEDALLFSGCYFAATGERADQRAFIGGILSKLDEEQEWVEWTTDALRREMRWERLAMVGLIFSVLLASGLLWILLT